MFPNKVITHIPEFCGVAPLYSPAAAAAFEVLECQRDLALEVWSRYGHYPGLLHRNGARLLRTDQKKFPSCEIRQKV